MPESIRALVAGLMMAVLVSGCAGAAASDRELLVSAAASLTDAFREIETEFEQVNPGVDVILNLAGSSLLHEQILSGAPVGVFASANLDIMAAVSAAGHLEGSYQVFAHNRMAIAFPEGNPADVRGLGALATDDLLVGLCAEAVPCGDFTRQVLAKAGIHTAADTEEPNARALLTKVEAGELDVAIVYATDIAASEGVDGLPIAEDLNVVAEYPIAVVAGAADPAIAEAFVAFVLSDEGRRVLRHHGFSLP